MNDNLEQVVARTLQQRADDVDTPDMSGIAASSIQKGRRLRRGRISAAAVGAMGCAVIIAVIFGASYRQDVSQRIQPAHPDSSTTPATETGPQTTPCASAAAPPSDVEVDTGLNTERGTLTYSFTDPASATTRTFAIAYRDDPSCAQDPKLKALIDHALEAADSSRSLNELERKIVTALASLNVDAGPAELNFNEATMWARLDDGRELFVNANDKKIDRSHLKVVDERRVGAVTVKRVKRSSGGFSDFFECAGVSYEVHGDIPDSFGTRDEFLREFLVALRCP